MVTRLSRIALGFFALGCGLFAGSLATAVAPDLVKSWTLRDALAKAHARSPVNVIFHDRADEKKGWKDSTQPMETASLDGIARHYGYSVRRVGRVSLLHPDFHAGPTSSAQLDSLSDWIAGQLPGGDRDSARKAMDQYTTSYQQEARTFAAGLPMGATPLSSLGPDQRARAHELLRENKVEAHILFLGQLLHDVDTLPPS